MVAVEVSRNVSHARAFSAPGIPCGGAIEFKHNTDEFPKLFALIEGAEKASGRGLKAVVVIEHTGVYHRTLSKAVRKSDRAVVRSGKSDGRNPDISKKGNRFMRLYLFLAMENMVRFGEDNRITRYYYRLLKTTRPHSHKSALVACCAKLARVILYMLVHKTEFAPLEQA